MHRSEYARLRLCQMLGLQLSASETIGLADANSLLSGTATFVSTTEVETDMEEKSGDVLQDKKDQ